MATFPSNNPYTTAQRAVLAYANSLRKGGTTAQAEAAAERAAPGMGGMTMAEISARARQAMLTGAAVAAGQEAAAAQYLFHQGAALGAETQGTIPVRLRDANGNERWITVQVSAPYGTDPHELGKLALELGAAQGGAGLYGQEWEAIDIGVGTIIA